MFGKRKKRREAIRNKLREKSEYKMKSENVAIPEIHTKDFDEIHQMFVPGREGKVFDVMIDSCGAFCGIMVSLITQKFIEKKKGNQI